MINAKTYLGNQNVKKDGVVEPWSQDDILEYKKCMDDPKYFAKTYCKVIHLDRGLVNFDLYPYQEKMFDHFNNSRFSSCRTRFYYKNIISLRFTFF